MCYTPRCGPVCNFTLFDSNWVMCKSNKATKYIIVTKRGRVEAIFAITVMGWLTSDILGVRVYAI